MNIEITNIITNNNLMKKKIFSKIELTLTAENKKKVKFKANN